MERERKSKIPTDRKRNADGTVYPSEIRRRLSLNKMPLSCGAKCAKLLLIVFTAFFWASGIILFTLGTYFLVEDERSLLFGLFANETTTYALPQYLAVAFILIGLAIFFIGFCGCCGAIRDNRFLLIIFMGFMLIIFALELTVGIMAIVFQEKVVAELKLKLTVKLQKQYGRNSALTAAIDLVQTKYECCGIGGPEDYVNSIWRNKSLGGKDNILVKTCCTLHNRKEKHSFINPIPVKYAICQSEFPQIYRHSEGCETPLENFIRSECLVFVLIGCGFAGTSLVGMIITLCLYRALGSNHHPGELGDDKKAINMLTKAHKRKHHLREKLESSFAGS